MTDDEILLLADAKIYGAYNVREVTDCELIAFARAIAAKEREACAKIVDAEKEIWDTPIYVRERLDTVAAEIRARGK